MTANKDLPQRGQNVDFSVTDFKILHFSARVKSCGKSEYMPARDVYFVNLVVEAPPSSASENAFIYYSTDYVQYRVAETPEKISEYFEKARALYPTLQDLDKEESEENKDKAEKARKSLANEYFTEGYDSNVLKVFDYNGKFNVFQYCQYIEKVPVTTAAIESLQHMKETGEGFSKSSATYYEFINLVQTLDMFWD
jgi:hypothetical protein